MKIKRKIGIGDVQHVRTQLLSVGILSPIDQEVQLEGACAAGTALNMMMRAQVMSPVNEDRLLDIMRKNSDHQILTYDTIGKDEFIAVFNTLDIIIEPEPFEIFTWQDVRDGIIDQWQECNGRFAEGNFGRLSQAELEKLFPEYAFDTDTESYWYSYADSF